MEYFKTFEGFLITEKPYTTDRILVFDIDHTLVITDAKIKVCDTKSGKCFTLTPEEFNDYEKNPHHNLDFSDFESLEIMKAGRMIEKYLNILRNAYQKGIAIGIVTARGDRKMIYKWLKEHVGFHIDIDLIFAINDPVHGFKGNIANRKKQAFETFIQMGYNNFQFYDDDVNNLRLVKSLEKDWNVEIITKKAKK